MESFHQTRGDEDADLKSVATTISSSLTEEIEEILQEVIDSVPDLSAAKIKIKSDQSYNNVDENIDIWLRHILPKSGSDFLTEEDIVTLERSDERITSFLIIVNTSTHDKICQPWC